MALVGRYFFVEGHVQGVFFREWTLARDGELLISGWVRNLRDGRVEIFAVADEQTLRDFASLLNQGSPASRVDRVTSMEAQIEKMKGFVRRSDG